MCSHFSIIVKVRIESDPLLPSSHEVDLHGDLWVLWGEVHIKLKAAISIWCL